MKIQQIALPTERLTLRPLRPSDAGLVALYAGDERVARMTTTIPHPLPPGAAQALIETANRPMGSETIWVIDGTKSDRSEVIGLISVEHGIERGEEVGYWVGPPFWNAGIATEALDAVIAHRFAEGVTRLVAKVFQDNAASAAVLRHCGFVYEGEEEAFSVARNAITPQWRYALEAPQERAR